MIYIFIKQNYICRASAADKIGRLTRITSQLKLNVNVAYNRSHKEVEFS